MVSFLDPIKFNPEHPAFKGPVAQMLDETGSIFVSLSLLEDVAPPRAQPVFLDHSMAMQQPGWESWHPTWRPAS